MTTTEVELRQMATQLQKSMDEGKQKMNFHALNLFEIIIEGIANNMRNDFEMDPEGEVRLLMIPVEPLEMDDDDVDDGDENEVGGIQFPLPMLDRKIENSQHEEKLISETHQEIERSLHTTYLKGGYFCPVERCRKKFELKTRWESHLRKHKAKPFGCRYRGCEVHYKQRSTAIRHIRVKHFKLPRTLLEQRQRKIVDNRNPNHFVRIAFN